MSRSVSFAARPKFDMTLAEAFPKVEPNLVPFGSRVLVQMRAAKSKTEGGIMIVGETKDTETWNTQVGKILATGPLAFRNRNTLDQWKEGAWAEVGDYVRTPKYGGDRYEVHIPGREQDEVVLLVVWDDLNLIGKVDDPLAVIAFV